MTVEELIKVSESLVFTEEDIEMLSKSLKELDDSFCKQTEAMHPTAEFLNRLYTL